MNHKEIAERRVLPIVLAFAAGVLVMDFAADRQARAEVAVRATDCILIPQAPASRPVLARQEAQP